MVHRPECGTELTEASDVEFQDSDPTVSGPFRASERLCVVGCHGCAAAIGSGVADGGD